MSDLFGEFKEFREFRDTDPKDHLRSKELQTTEDIINYLKTDKKSIIVEAQNNNRTALKLIVHGLALIHLLEDHPCNFLEQILGNLVIDDIEAYEESINI